MISQKNISHIVVGGDSVLSTGTRAALTNGQIGVYVNGSSTASTSALSAGDRFKVVYKTVEGNIIESPFINFDEVTESNAVAYAAPTEQVTYVGYNGTTGAIAVNNDEVYYAYVVRKDGTKAFSEHPFLKLIAVYKSDSDATQREIAEAVLANAVKNFQIEKQRSRYQSIVPGLISSAAVTAGNVFEAALTVIKGENYVTAASSGEYGTNVAVVVGDQIRIGTVGGGTTLTSPVYTVKSISGTTTKTFVLDRPVSNASGTYAVATVDAEVIPTATANNVATNYGISFTGQPLKYEPGLFKYQKLTFDITLNSAFESTPITTSQNASKGTGTYEEVSEVEWFLKGNRGETFRVAAYPVKNTLNAVVGETYSFVSVAFENSNSKSIDSKVLSFIGLLIATPNATAYASLQTVLGI